MIGLLWTRNARAWTSLALVAAFAASALAGCAGRDTGDLTLKLGTMMPLTGALASLGPDMQAGAKLAIKHVNDANKGLRIEAFHENDGTTDTSAAPGTFNRLVGQGMTALAGPCCSGVTDSILSLAVQNQVVVSTPSATSPKLTLERDNQGYFWRVPPSDAIQGKVLAGLVKENNATTISMIIVNNAYGNGLADVFKQRFTTDLGGVVVKTEKYDEGSTSFASQVDSVCALPRPQGIVLVAYIDDGAAILKEMQAKACLSGMKVFGSEGVYDQGFPDKAGTTPTGRNLAEGAKGTTPQFGNTTRFRDLFRAEYGHEPALYAHESYDAVMYVAIAAYKAKSTKGSDIKAQLLGIANPPGTMVTTFEKAVEEIDSGVDVDYVGVAHDFEFDARHEPKKGVYSYWEVINGKITITATGKTA